jgi:RHS repeat-associated protein
LSPIEVFWSGKRKKFLHTLSFIFSFFTLALVHDSYCHYHYDPNGNTSKKLWYAYGAPPETRGSQYMQYDHSALNLIIAKKFVEEISTAQGINKSSDQEEILNYDGDNELIFSEQRSYAANAYNLAIFSFTNIVHGYDGGKLIYKNMASGDVFDWLQEGPPWDDLIYYTYLNGIKVGVTSFFTMPADSHSTTLKVIEARLAERAKQQKESPFAALSARRGNEQLLRSLRRSMVTNRGGETDLTMFWLYDGQGNKVDETNNAAYRSYGEPFDGISDGYKGYDMGPCSAYTYGIRNNWELSYKTGVRIYDPESGRFMSPDPFKGYLSEPASQNPYMYCRGNPVKYSDPSGYYQMTEEDQKKYPEFAKFVEHIGENSTPQEKAALDAWGNKDGTGQLDVNDALTWNHGPKIVISSGTQVNKDTGAIEIDSYIAGHWGDANIFDKPGMFALYGVALLFHETVNYGHYQKDPAYFQKNAYGIDKRYAHRGFNKDRYGDSGDILRYWVHDNYSVLNAMRGR